MPEKRRSQKSSEGDSVEEISVQFRPIFGVSPRTYVPALYAALVAALLFFLLVFPGIRNNGSEITFTSSPPGASVLIDGVRLGATPFTTFVPRGTRSLEVRKPFFETATDDMTVGGRLVGSLLFPRRRQVDVSLEIAAPEAVLDDASRRFSQWALIGRASAQFQFPLVAAPAVEDLVFSRAEVTAAEQRAFVLAQAASARSDVQLRDVLRATSLVEQSGTALGSRQLVQAVRVLAETVVERPATPFWFAGAARDVPDFGEYETSSYFQQHLEQYTTRLLAESLRTDTTGEQVATNRVEVDGIGFALVPAGRLVLGGMDGTESGIDPFSVPVAVDIDAFYMMETEVSVAMFRRFVSERPQFGPAERPSLTAAGLATEEYLAPFGRRDYLETAEASEPVRAVSYAAASAFADWLGQRLPAGLSELDVRLPTERQWEWAAEVNAANPQEAHLFSEAESGPRSTSDGAPGRLGISDLLGNVWEWCRDWYRPAAYSFLRADAAASASPVDPIESFPSRMRVVRGGSWANPADDVSIRSRGAQQPEWSTPYLGFRVVLVQSDGN